MNKLPVIGLVGHARVGKDVCASYISRRLGGVQIAFADKIKEILMEMFDLDRDYFYGETGLKDLEIDKYPGWSPRKLMQFIGTDSFRKVWDDVWINYTKKRIETILTKGYCPLYKEELWGKNKVVVVSDIRFINEAQAIKDLGGEVWKIVRPGQDGKNLGYKEHASEKEQDLIPEEMLEVVVNNDSSLDELYKKLEICIQLFQSKNNSI